MILSKYAPLCPMKAWHYPGSIKLLLFTVFCFLWASFVCLAKTNNLNQVQIMEH